MVVTIREIDIQDDNGRLSYIKKISNIFNKENNLDSWIKILPKRSYKK